MNNIVVNRDKITINVVSLNPAHGEVYSIQDYAQDEVCLIQHYMIESVSDLRQVSDYLWVFRFPPIKLTTTI
jgi:hypothetical protein